MTNTYSAIRKLWSVITYRVWPLEMRFNEPITCNQQYNRPWLSLVAYHWFLWACTLESNLSFGNNKSHLSFKEKVIMTGMQRRYFSYSFVLVMKKTYLSHSLLTRMVLQIWQQVRSVSHCDAWRLAIIFSTTMFQKQPSKQGYFMTVDERLFFRLPKQTRFLFARFCFSSAAFRRLKDRKRTPLLRRRQCKAVRKETPEKKKKSSSSRGTSATRKRTQQGL